jgi:hypothetical protein
MVMARFRNFSKPVQTRLGFSDFQKFELLRRKKKITAGELARMLLSRSLSEVKTDG